MLFITVLGIISSIAVLTGIEDVILDFEAMKNTFLLSYIYLFLTELFLILMVLPELAYTYCSESIITIILSIFNLCHFMLLQWQNKNIVMNNLNLYKKSIEMIEKYDDVSSTMYYKYANFLFKINIVYIFIYSWDSLLIRQCITLIYAIFLIYFYYKMKCNSEILNFYGKKKLFYELCYKLLFLILVFIFSEYLYGLLAAIILAIINLPVRNNVAKLLRK